MKPPFNFLLQLAALVCASAALAQPSPTTPAVKPVQVNRTTGALVDPPEFFTANSAAVSAASPVQSVAGKTGAVTLTKSDVGLGNVANVDTTNAANLSSGTLIDARLSSNIPRLNTANTYSQQQNFARTHTGSATQVLSSTNFNSSFQISGTSSQAPGITMSRAAADALAGVTIYGVKTRSATVGDYSAGSGLLTNDTLVFIGGEGSDNEGGVKRGATIAMYASGNWSATSAPSHIQFSTTASGATTPTERMRIHANGTVTLGTTSDSSNGRIQLTAHTTAAGGIGFGTDTNLYRSAADTLRTDDAFVAASFTGVGSALTALNATQLTSGTVPTARLPAKLATIAGLSTANSLLALDGSGNPYALETSDLELRLRQGTDAERQTVIFAGGEPVWTTDTKELYVGDGSTLGGHAARVRELTGFVDGDPIPTVRAGSEHGALEFWDPEYGAWRTRILVADGIVSFRDTDDGRFAFANNGFQMEFTASASGGIEIVSGGAMGVMVGVPASSTAAGVVGQWAADSTHLYICTAPNTWRRVSLSSW